MKTLLSTFAILGVFTSAFAVPYTGPVLVYKLGALAHAGSEKTCYVYANDPALAGKDVSALIETASRAEISRALHIRAEVPSIEYYAIKVAPEGAGRRVARTSKVLLIQDYSDLRARQGDEAAELVALTKTACE